MDNKVSILAMSAAHPKLLTYPVAEIVDVVKKLRIFQSSPAIAISSLTQATAIGVPPRVPSHVMDGTLSFRTASFDAAVFTNPTGVPIRLTGLFLFVWFQ